MHRLLFLKVVLLLLFVGTTPATLFSMIRLDVFENQSKVQMVLGSEAAKAVAGLLDFYKENWFL